MNILQIHDENVFRGGEEIVCDLEYKILTEKGHTVRQFIVPPIREFTLRKKLSLMRRYLYNREAKMTVIQEIRRFKPDLVHVHNYFPTLTAAVFDACRETGIPSLLTLHNFRFMVPDGKLTRGDEKQNQPFFWLGLKQVLRRSYRNSFFYSLGVLLMISYNRIRKSWIKNVNAFIYPSKWMKDFFLRYGIQESRLYLKPHFVEDPFEGKLNLNTQRHGYVYVGRLSQEKGIVPLIRFWKSHAGSRTLAIIGTGPQEPEVKSLIKDCENITCEGYYSRDRLQKTLNRFKAMICTSRNHETFGLVVIEAFSAGTPVIAPDLYAYKELIEEGENGFLFEPDRFIELKPYLNRLDNDEQLLKKMVQNARDNYESRYTPEIHYRRYMEIVNDVLSSES